MRKGITADLFIIWLDAAALKVCSRHSSALLDVRPRVGQHLRHAFAQRVSACSVQIK